MHHWQSNVNSYTQYLQSIPFIPGKYCPRISTERQQQLVDHCVSAVSQIAYPNETHDNKNTEKCSSLIFSHRQNPGRVLMTHWRRSRARQRKCSASSTSLTFNIIYLIFYHIQPRRTHLQRIYLEVNRAYFLLVICCGVWYVFCFIYMTYFDCTYSDWLGSIKLRLELCKSLQGEQSGHFNIVLECFGNYNVITYHNNMSELECKQA